MAIITIELGYVENFISNHCLVMWWYKRETPESPWRRVSTEKCHPSQREYFLKKVLKKAIVVPLGRGS